MTALSQLVQELGAEARRRWYFIAIIFGSVGAMAAAGLMLEVTL